MFEYSIEIKGLADGVLSFVWHGRRVTVRSVQHPGTKGAHMFRDTVARLEPQIKKIFDGAAERIAKHLAGGA